ncbi:MAG: ABC transporter ATP-binding protein [Anaerolineae bacterium]|nr:MAG: ABC transporter ATP-binding protein [Anaerolineae bacterium]MCL4880017.1 ABC transporter ATP-binding protein [Anaerolineae bacterium]
MALLKIKNLKAGYGDIEILHDVSLEVNPGETVALIGANGAGKTTTLRTISGLIRSWGGDIHFDGQAIQNWRSNRIVAAGLIQVPEGRKLFPKMTVLENLEMGSFIRTARRNRARNLKRVFELFPRLAERKSQLAGTLSGGEQQMVAIARGLMSQPRLLMLDEPSLGLAPLIVSSIFEVIKEINKVGTTVLIVEQNAVQTLGIADRGYVLENGIISLAGTGQELLKDERIRSAYLGL